MSDHSTARRCPSCRTIGRMHRSHSRSGFERAMHTLNPVMMMYRCHQCNWRGYMFRKFPSLPGWLFWISVTMSCAVSITVISLLYKFFVGR